MTAIYAKLFRYGAIAALLVLGAASLYFKGRSEGVASEQTKTAAEHALRVAAESLQATLAGQLKDQNAAVSAARAQAQQQQAQAQSLAEQVEKERASAASASAQWSAKLSAATAKPECHTLQEELCDSVLDY